MRDDEQVETDGSGSIHLRDDNEVRRWTQALGVDETCLRVAIAEVGISTDAVLQFLGK